MRSLEISRLKRDLVASEEVVHYQKGELKRHKEKFEKERSCWMHQLEECKRKISHYVDIEEEQRKLIIERATLRHQLEVAEGRESLLRNNLGDHQALLNDCHLNMGRARLKVHQLAEQTSYVIKNQRRMNDQEVADQERTIVSHLPKVPISEPFFPPGYGPFDNCGVGPSMTRPQGMPFRNNPTVTTATPVYTLPQPTVMQRAAQEGQFTTHLQQ
ncbi:uncharacterized protein LOC107020209 [Solanum pennellii]|uniref:Uncharacterized protein LOC107020209 n=1 Tax=Solanum pennellii TaxID=28526 RepID=A0ABM1GU01_SOLPN|nr:uncharacterized protein LOC107020209 [Solanum pennellii]